MDKMGCIIRIDLTNNEKREGLVFRDTIMLNVENQSQFAE